MQPTALPRLLAMVAAIAFAAGCAPPRTATPAPSPPPVGGEASAAPSPTPPRAYPGSEETRVSPVPTGVPALLASPNPVAEAALLLSARVVRSYPHDPQAFTQGLVYLDDASFYEGTGLNGASSLRKVDLASGQVTAIFNLEREYFGEGIAVVGERVFQLTWRSGVGFIYTYASGAFNRVGTFTYPPAGRSLPVEGWGLTFDGARLIMSDGTASLYFVDPEATARTGTLAVTGQVEVRDDRGPVTWLNELEYVNGEVLANIWQSDRIARIDPATGRVLAYVDLSELRSLLPPAEYGPSPPEVLNGIAYDAASGRLFVTGKLWPRVFEIELVETAWRIHLPLARTIL
ncbi:MAG: glutaminyl-peptide cyclotransferase [Oscillochloridaceae bacterium]|nr:glutaminyl-peptide cyclotransferase [Chloroflexaceae bacterium]MDW8389461.1 glutaminyl-peptide cyclotransferase [Oscillochloridaceae bacterium]